MSRTPARRISFLVCFSAGLALAAWFSIEALGAAIDNSRVFDPIVVSGYAAITALALSLLVSPIRRLASWLGVTLPQTHLLAFRRSLGLLAAVMAMLHFVAVALLHLNGKWVALVENFFLSTGVTAGVLLLVLGLSSFQTVNRWLRIRFWRELHLLAYAAAITAAAHLSLSAFAPNWVSIALVAIVPALFLLRLLPMKRAGVSVRSETSASVAAVHVEPLTESAEGVPARVQAS